MTHEQINESLARWLSARTSIPYAITEAPFGWRLLCGTQQNERQAFTVSLDSMALVEAAMTEDELRAYHRALLPACGTDRMLWLRASAETRARAAVRALGLETETDGGD